MDLFLLNHEMTIRLGGFVAVLGIMAAWELLAPRRALRERKALRWANNLALSTLDAALVRIALPAAAVGVAVFAADHAVGLLNVVDVSYPLAILLSVLALDLAICLQHRMFHAVPLFWRVHRVHHVHHSIEPRETNSNFGFNLPWWDRLFGTYRAEPRAGHEAMTIGIAQFRSPRELNPDRMLLQPFRADDGAYSGPYRGGEGADERCERTTRELD